MADTKEGQGKAAETETHKNDHWLKLYELTLDEHHFYNQAHHRLINLYIGILSALVTATGVGFLQAAEWHHYAFLCLGPILILAVSRIAKEGVFREYQRLLETITVRAKIEQELGMTTRRENDRGGPDLYWKSEPIIPRRHLLARHKHESSQTFMDEYNRKGLQHSAESLFRAFQWLGIAMLAGLLWLAACRLLQALSPCLRALCARLALLFCPI